MAGRRLFCFAMQSRSGGGKKSATGRCGQAIGAQPVPSARSRHQRTQWVGMTEGPGRRHGGDQRLPTRVLRWHCLGRILFADAKIVTLKKDVITPMMGRRRHAA